MFAHPLGFYLYFCKGNGYLGGRVATGFSSVRKILNVPGFVPAQGDPEEWPCGPFERGLVG